MVRRRIQHLTREKKTYYDESRLKHGSDAVWVSTTGLDHGGKWLRFQTIRRKEQLIVKTRHSENKTTVYSFCLCPASLSSLSASVTLSSTVIPNLLWLHKALPHTYKHTHTRLMQPHTDSMGLSMGQMSDEFATSNTMSLSPRKKNTWRTNTYRQVTSVLVKIYQPNRITNRGIIIMKRFSEARISAPANRFSGTRLNKCKKMLCENHFRKKTPPKRFTNRWTKEMSHNNSLVRGPKKARVRWTSG